MLFGDVPADAQPAPGPQAGDQFGEQPALHAGAAVAHAETHVPGAGSPPAHLDQAALGSRAHRVRHQVVEQPLEHLAVGADLHRARRRRGRHRHALGPGGDLPALHRRVDQPGQIDARRLDQRDVAPRALQDTLGELQRAVRLAQHRLGVRLEPAGQLRIARQLLRVADRRVQRRAQIVSRVREPLL